MSNSLFNSFRSFFGLPATGGEPRNDFRNPIWGSDDEDDDDDELYHAPETRSGDLNITIYTDPADFNRVMSSQMEEMFRMFNGMMGGVRSFFDEEQFAEPGSVLNAEPTPAPEDGSIRDHYLKPGYNGLSRALKEDVDLDGKISSQEIAGLLKRKDLPAPSPGRCTEERRPNVDGSFFQTIITRSVTKSDGTVETRRIVKDHLGNVEETVTTVQRDGRSADNSCPVAEPFLQENSIFKDFSSLWKIF